MTNLLTRLENAKEGCRVARALVHYSEKPLTKVESRSQDGDYHNRGYKPNGLWVSVEGDDDWPSWCRSENFGLSRIAHASEVVLKPDARVLRVTTPRELLRFTENYGIKRKWPYETTINWPEVAAKYQGIIIAPYIWTERLNLFWYYGWDCASGVIWDATCIAALRARAA